MIWFALSLGAVGLSLSAFFSGSETGFYRVTRIRLVLDALGGDLVARGLLWLTNHPSLFIATTLVGNNLANYVTTLAIVIGSQSLLGADSLVVELVMPLVFAPVLFVYGELLPKNLFLHAPNRLVRKGGPLFLVFLPLFFPVSALLWALNRVMATLVTETPETVRLAIARRELRRVLEEGHEAGILRPAQHELARGIFAVAKRPVSDSVTPLQEIPRARADAAKSEIQQLARRHQLPAVLIEDPRQPDRLIGYVLVIDLDLNPSSQVGPIRPLLRIGRTNNHLDALMRLHSQGETLAEVMDNDGRTLGIVTAHGLREPLFRGAQLSATREQVAAPRARG
jgi:CBS domain containing-hemolysin-like protein